MTTLYSNDLHGGPPGSRTLPAGLKGMWVPVLGSAARCSFVPVSAGMVGARHDARPKRSGTTRIDHPLVGPLELSYEKLPIPDVDRQALGVYHAAPGSASAQALALRATTAAEEREPVRDLMHF